MKKRNRMRTHGIIYTCTGLAFLGIGILWGSNGHVGLAIFFCLVGVVELGLARSFFQRSKESKAPKEQKEKETK